MNRTYVDYGRRFLDSQGLVHVGYGKYGLLYTQCQFHWNLPNNVVLAAHNDNAFVTCLWCSITFLLEPHSA